MIIAFDVILTNTKCQHKFDHWTSQISVIYYKVP